MPGNLEESAVGAYAGVIAMLFVAPLAFWSRRHRSFNLFLAALAIFGLSWILNVPIIVGVLRLPGLNMMSHNRLVFATCFAFVALAGVGLEMLSKGTLRWQRWHWLLVLPLALLSWLWQTSGASRFHEVKKSRRSSAGSIAVISSRPSGSKT
jgi:hypothetical protein